MVHHLTVLSGTARQSPRKERAEVPVSAAPSEGTRRLHPLCPVLPRLPSNNEEYRFHCILGWEQDKGTLMTSQFPACWPKGCWLDLPLSIRDHDLLFCVLRASFPHHHGTTVEHKPHQCDRVILATSRHWLNTTTRGNQNYHFYKRRDSAQRVIVLA